VTFALPGKTGRQGKCWEQRAPEEFFSGGRGDKGKSSCAGGGVHQTAGVDVDRTFIDDRPSHQSGGDFDVARAGWIGDYSDPQNFLFLFESGNGKFD